MTARARGSAGQHVPIAGAIEAAIAAALALVTLAVFAPVRGHQFLNYDDNAYVTEHPLVRTGLTRASVAWALTGVHHATWHPLTTLTHLLDVELYGLNAGAHLTVNVVLHTLAAVVLFLTLYGMTGARWPSAWVAALFAWHPLHVESVAWVSERKDVLSGLGWMLTLAAYLAYVRRPTWTRYAAVIGVFALGLLAKPMLVTLPFVLLLLDWWPLGRVARGGSDAPAARTPGALVVEKIPLLALAIGASIVTIVAQQSAGALNSMGNSPLSFRVGNALVSYALYLWKTVWPAGLVVFYPPATELPIWKPIAGALVLLAISLLVARQARRVPALAVGWLWYLGTLVPVIGLVRQGDQALADRFTYLPSIGLFLMAAWGIPTIATRNRTPPWLAVAAGAVLIACIGGTAQQLRHWESSVTLFTHALAVDPANYVATGNLGAALGTLGRHDEALQLHRRAVELQPTNARFRVALGSALARLGRRDAAEAEYVEAVRLDPTNALAEYDLGLVRAERGALDDAIAHYRRAIALDPRYAKAYHNLGWALAERGAFTEAIPAYQQALALDAGLIAAHNNLAIALERVGRTDEALAHYAAAVALAPDEPRAHANYGALLAGTGRQAEAITEYRAALRLNPDFAEVRAALAETEAAMAAPAR